MPLQKLQFRPGVNREGTTLANEGGWFDSEKIRFRSGYPEKIGGWLKSASGTYLGICRSLGNWVTLRGYNLLGVGTNLKFYVEDNGGGFYDVTPIRTPTSTNTVTFSANTTTPSSTITVTDSAASGLQIGDFVTFSQAASLGGNITAAILNQEYQIVNLLGTTSYTVQARAVSSVEAPGAAVLSNASDAGNGGGATDAVYQINTGQAIYTTGTGWGSGPWPPYLIATLTNPFATTNGSSNITVTQAAHGLATGNSVVFQSISASNVSNISSTILVKAFAVKVINANAYNVSTSFANVGGINITYTANATASSLGGNVTVLYPDAASPASYSRGWGSGFTTTFGLQLRLWSQVNFGERLLFSPRGGALYVWDPTSAATPAFGTRGTVVSGTDVPALINEVMVSDATRIVICLGCNDYGSYGSTPLDPMLIRWSDAESYTNWTPSPINQAGDFRLSIGSEIVGGLQSRQEILIWTDAALYSMQYLGPPVVWGFTLLADNISVASPNAMVQAAGIIYWMGTDKFYTYTGRVETLPCSVRQYVFEDFNHQQESQIYCGTNEGYNEVWWFFCSADSDIINRYVIYNYLDRVWYYGTMNRTAWLDSPLRPTPTAATLQAFYFVGSITDNVLTITEVNYGTVTIGAVLFAEGILNGTTIVGLETGTGGTGTYTVSQAQTLASTKMSGSVNGQNLIVYHEAQVDDGISDPAEPINAYVQSSDFDIEDGHQYGFVDMIVPDITFNGSSTPDPNKPEVTLTLRPRQNPGANYNTADTPIVASTQSYAGQVSYNVQQFTQIVYTRIRGRQIAFRISSGTLGTQWQLGVPRINIRPDGRRA